MNILAMSRLLLTADTSSIMDTTDSVGKLSKWISYYGFMIVFCAVVLVIIIFGFAIYSKNYNKKQETEMALLQQEKLASIDQSKKMFDLVTTVQTEQVSQLQQMTRALQDISHDVNNNSGKMNVLDRDIQSIQKNSSESNHKSDTIVSTVSEILDYSKENKKYNEEILERVKRLECILLKQDRDILFSEDTK